MSVDALMHTMFELHNAIQFKDVNAVDQKVQQIIKQYDLLKPGSHDIEELYQKENLAGQLSTGNAASPELLARLQHLENAIVKKVSEARPDLELEKRFDRQERFATACQKPAVRKGEDLSELESILKEGPVDFSAITIPVTTEEGITEYHSLLIFALTRAQKNHLLTFLLQNGVSVNNSDVRESAAIIDYIIPTDLMYRRLHCDDKTLEALFRAGFDINATLPEDENIYLLQTTLLYRAINLYDNKQLRNIVYYGAGNINDDRGDLEHRISEKKENYKSMQEAIRLREELLVKMQSHLSAKERKSYKDLSLEERSKLANMCRETQSFRDAFAKKTLGVKERDDDWIFSQEKPKKDPEAEKAMAERIALHNDFIKVCREGNLEAAEKMLPRGIDINANLIPHPENPKKLYPLLNHACKLGDVKLAEFLLKHGARVDVGSDEYFPEWLPPLFDVAITPMPNKLQIVALLLNAGANPNEMSAGRYWAGLSKFREPFWDSKSNVKDLLDGLSSCGIDINIPSMKGNSMFAHAFDQIFPFVTKKILQQKQEVAKLLIYYGATVTGTELDVIKRDSMYQPLGPALKIREQAIYEYHLEKHLKELEALKPLSLDLVNIIQGYLEGVDTLDPKQTFTALIDHLKELEVLKPLSSDLVNMIQGFLDRDYTSEVDLTPQQRLEIAHRCLEIEGRRKKEEG